jgi:hypothetical protein
MPTMAATQMPEVEGHHLLTKLLLISSVVEPELEPV